MNDTIFLGVSIALLSALLFLTSPLRYRHWAVFAFVVASFLVALIGLPAKTIIVAIVAVLLWLAVHAVDRWA